MMKNIRDLIIITLIGFLFLYLSAFIYNYLNMLRESKSYKIAYVWQKIQYDKWNNHEVRDGPVDKGFYWNEYPSSKAFYTELQMKIHGCYTYAVHKYTCGQLARAYNNYSHEVVLEMVDQEVVLKIGDKWKEKEKDLIHEFDIAMNLLLDEYKKKNLTVTPAGKPQIYRPENDYKNVVPIKAGLFSLPGSFFLWIYFMIRNKRKKGEVSNNTPSGNPAPPSS